MGRPKGSKNRPKTNGTPAATETSTERATPAKQLLALIAAKNSAVAKTASISGEIGERIKNAAENGHLHRKAFAVVAAADRMEEDRRNDFVRSLRLYLDICEHHWDGEGHVGDLADQAAQSAEADDAAHVAENIKNLAGIGQLTEEERKFDDDTSSKPSRRVRKGAGEIVGIPGADAAPTIQ